MAENAQHIIARIGETDQLYLSQNTPELSLERGDLRLQLVVLSNMRQEQIHFLQEAIVILEQARIEYEEIPLALYLSLSLHLAKAYMLYFELNRENRFALITQQILKPLAHHEEGNIYFFLAYASAAQKEHALTRHWLKKYTKTAEFDPQLLQVHPAFDPLRTASWFQQMIAQTLH
ncbi:hypothetical protein [Acinetobacter sp. CAAS 2-6]|uniref:hypothetical protein n=1 Tax=Acinetobacter sp. CAAS 2-6 TaxID=3016358 RepID=UPI002DD63026|nr:hypothetical protein [Acinetobacter sp. CAAS 2-6]